MSEIRPGDVVRYSTLSRPNRWCREGMATTERGEDRTVLVDTYWDGGSERHVLTPAEVSTAEVLFNLDDYEELPRYQPASSRGRWAMYAPADRQVITSQHGLTVRYFVRKGAQPDPSTQVDNARVALDEAKAALSSAQSAVAYRQAELERLTACRCDPARPCLASECDPCSERVRCPVGAAVAGSRWDG